MKERPILFSAPMVRAILAGQKTQTRRVVKPTIKGCTVGAYTAADLVELVNVDEDGGPVDAAPFVCPYGAPGDRLWVKETWRTSIACDASRPSDLEQPGRGYGWPVWYAADAGAVTWRGAREGGPGFTSPGKTRVSIHMPRWASRIDLEVTGVRVERLHAITEEDAKAEGVCPAPAGTDDDGAHFDAGCHRDSFTALWDAINGKPRPMLDDDGEPVLDDDERPIMVAPKSWASNPWVWVVEFSRLQP